MRVLIERSLYFILSHSLDSDEELRDAYNSYNDFLKSACTPKNRTLCTKALFPKDRVNRSTLFLPPGIYVKRCDNPLWSSMHWGGSLVSSYQAMLDQATRLRSHTALKSMCSVTNAMDTTFSTYSGSSTTPEVVEFDHFDSTGSCTCLMPEEECLPTVVNLKVASIVVYNVSCFRKVYVCLI